MKVRILIFLFLTIVILCVAVLLTIRQLVWNGSITTERITVFVNDVESVGDAKCVWVTGSHFDVKIPGGPTSRFSINVFNESEQVLTVSVRAYQANELEAESIKVHLLLTDADGSEQEVHMKQRYESAQIQSSEKNRIISWGQHYQITNDLTKARKGSVRLQWSMEYRDANGELKSLSITVPLRRMEISIPSSIVEFDAGMERAWVRCINARPHSKRACNCVVTNTMGRAIRSAIVGAEIRADEYTARLWTISNNHPNVSLSENNIVSTATRPCSSKFHTNWQKI